MDSRIKELRKFLKLSQTDFGKHLGVSRDVINNLENKRVTPTEPIIKLMVSEFKVNRTWLESGEGDMFAEMGRDEEIAEYIGSVLSEEDDSFQKRLISALSRMSVEEWEVLERLITRLADPENQKESE